MEQVTKDAAKEAYSFQPHMMGGKEWHKAAILITGYDHVVHIARGSYQQDFANGSLQITRPECGSQRLGGTSNPIILAPTEQITCAKCKRSRYAKESGR